MPDDLSFNSSFKCWRTQAVKKTWQKPFLPSPGQRKGVSTAPRHSLQVVGEMPWGQDPLKACSGFSQWHSQDQALPSGVHACLLVRRWGALPAVEFCPWIRAAYKQCSVCSWMQDVSFGSTDNREMLIQNWAEVIIQKSHKWIPLAFSSMKLGWCSSEVRNFDMWLGRMKVGSTFYTSWKHRNLYSRAGWRVSRWEECKRA